MAAGAATPASAHVKWFAPYIVGAPPAPIGQTLRDGWFWLAIGLVMAFFIGARSVEIGSYGNAVLVVMTRLQMRSSLAATPAFVQTKRRK